MQSEKRPWGKYEVLLDEEYCKVKKITVSPSGELSLQYHCKRDENWIVVSGQGVFTINSEERLISYGDSVKILKTQHHTIRNESDENLVFIEVQTGDYFGEDDIVRLKDKYNRVSNVK